jgi:flagellar M-ring protein FliF
MMQNLNQLGRQLLEIWKQLGLNQKVSIVLAALVVVGGLTGLMFWSSRAEYSLLYGKLDEDEAAKVVAVIEETKIPYRIGNGGSSLYVPQDKVGKLRMQLAEKKLPSTGHGVGYELLDQQTFGLSDFSQQANLQRAIQGELARTISQLDEVESSWVMIAAPRNQLLVDDQKRPTASVFITMKGQTQLSPQAVNSIQFLVANAVNGLQASSVSVVDNRGNTLSENNQPESLAGMTSTQFGVRSKLEQYLAKKAEDMLTKVLGPGQAVVRVSAEINFDTINRVEKVFDPDGQVANTETINDENTDTTAANSGGAVGVMVNSTTETNLATTAPLSTTRMRKKVTNKEYSINETNSTILQAAGNIKRLSAAVFVASRMEGTGAERKPVPRTPEDLLKLRNIVQNAIGIVSDGASSRKDEIALEEMPFNDQLAMEFGREIEGQRKQDFWWTLSRNLLYPALALAVLLVFWRAFRRTPVENIPIGIPLGNFARKANGNGHGNGHGNGNGAYPWAEESEPAMVTVDVLNQLVRENPANMTQAIRTWMTKSKEAN